MKKIQWTEDELQSINLHGGTCDADARAAMQRSGINFDDIEQINDHYETHRWGSDADRRYRKAAVNKAIRRVAANPLMYAAPRQEEAAVAWNRRAQPENEPLTLSELRGMGGEPVWIQESAPYTFAGYKILCSPVVDEYEDVCFEGGDCYYSHDYGKAWLAYRAKPERSEGE